MTETKQPIPQRILAICFGGLGDVVLFFSTIQTLRRLYPNSRLAVVVEPRCRDLMERQYLVDQVYTFDIKNKPGPADYLRLIDQLRTESPDVALSMGRSPMVPWLLFLSGAPRRIGYGPNRFQGLLTDVVPLKTDQYAAAMYHDLTRPLGGKETPVPTFPVGSPAEDWAKRFLESKGITEAPVVIHPGVSRLSRIKGLVKSWDPANWRQLINHLLEKGYPVLLAGGPDDEEVISLVRPRAEESREGLTVIAGETKSLEQMAAIMKMARLVISVDSGPLHLAVGVGAPTVAIFGPTDPDKILPPDGPFTAVCVDIPCRPCLFETRQTSCEELTCLKQLQVKTVWEAVKATLEEREAVIR